MNFVRKIKFVFITILLTAVFWLYFNQASNGHYHKLPNGEIVHHAHPYNHQNNNESPFEDHKHSKSEYFILAQISNPFVLLSVFLVIISPLIIPLKIIGYQPNKVFSTYKYQYPNVYRGPPGFLKCSSIK
ncbi:MAG: hypothetical protein KAV44_05035 [Bacteroidales bacterium]|nr:hypothetical protein [Bacteroidales bacterium]